MTVPVYDYALMTEPLTDEQLEAIGWKERQGIGDMANQFHYYRLSKDNRILFGGYDAIYYAGREVKEAYEDREETFRKLASHFFTTFPQLEGLRFSHKWGGAIDSSTQFCTFFGTARKGRVAYAAGFTGLGVGSTRFAADVMLDLLAGQETERTRLEMVRKRPLPFPPEALRLDWDQPDPLVDGPGRSQRGQTEPDPQNARRRGAGFRLLDTPVHPNRGRRSINDGHIGTHRGTRPRPEAPAATRRPGARPGNPRTAVHELEDLRIRRRCMGNDPGHCH